MLKDFNSSFHDRDRDINDKYKIQRHFNNLPMYHSKLIFLSLVLKMLEGVFLAVGTRLYSSSINLKKLMRVLFLGQRSVKTKALLARGRNKLATGKVFSKALGETVTK